MIQVAVAVVVVAVALGVAWGLQRRRRPDAPTQPTVWPVPAQLDRADFDAPSAPWLVAVFTSSGCDTCEAVTAKARVLGCGAVAVVDVEVGDRPDLHRRYHIEAVPITVIADATGVVRASFTGPMTATDLWAAVAEVRRPGSSPEPHLGRPRG